MLFDPLAETILAYDRMAVDYSRKWFTSAVIDEFVDVFVASLPMGATVLDAGCGSGREIKKLSDAGFDCVGIDLSRQTVAMAKINFPGGHFRIMDFRQLDYPPSLFDGVICVASVHHLLDDDFRRALESFKRVLKPRGKLALTIRLGAGYEFDKFQRFNYYRTQESSIGILEAVGFKVLNQALSDAGTNREWLQLILGSDKEESSKSDPLCSFCRGSLFMQENRTGKLPGVASVLWGDDDFYVTVDRAPLTDGHLLICSNKHVLSMYGNHLPLPVLATHKSAVDALLYKAYNKRPLFLEHGMSSDKKDNNPCTDHAHIHAVPLAKELKSIIERTTGRLSVFRDAVSLDQSLRGHEYVSYDDKKGRIFVRKDGLASLPSQFFRMVVARDLEEDDFHWTAVANHPKVLSRYQNTLERLLGVLDSEYSKQHVFSNAPEAVTNRLCRGRWPTEIGNRSSVEKVVLSDLARTRRAKADTVANAPLSEFGEETITEDIVFKIFEYGNRGISQLGDDAAVIAWNTDEKMVVSTDPCPTPVFFELGYKDFRAYGWLAAVISLSDMAAMGARPNSILVDCEMPPAMKVGSFVNLLEGIKLAANRYHCNIIGGNIREAQKLRVATTVIGETVSRRSFKRSNASPGEGVYVAGEMGLFWAAVIEKIENDVLPTEMHAQARRALFYPDPQVNTSLILSRAGIVGACMDASDGPTRCFSEIAKASNVNIEVHWEELLPSQPVEIMAGRAGIDPKLLMLTWGNFELVFTADDEALERRFTGTEFYDSLKRVGEVRQGNGRSWLNTGQGRKPIPDLSSMRFQSSTSLLEGVQAYFNQLKETDVSVG